MRTPAQRTLLLHYLQKEQEVPSKLRVKVTHDPRVERTLLESKLLEVVAHHYGPLYGLTETGHVEAIAIQNET